MASALDDPSRLREVHRYYERKANIPLPNTQAPTPSNVASTSISIADSALIAFLQLVTLKLSKQQAVVSLVDKDHQYFIAESTPTGKLLDSSLHGKAGSAVWIGCEARVPHGESLWANIVVAEDVPGSYPIFEVTSLPSDPRFASLPFVKGLPLLQYYAGTPLISKSGFRIGSLFVVDSDVHTSLSKSEIDFFGIMATNVMRYLEMETESREQKRHMTMSKGLAALVEGKSRIPYDWNHSHPHDTGTSRTHAMNIDAEAPETSERTPVPETEINVSFAGPGEGSLLHKGVFARASNLLRESLDVDYSVFVDTSKAHAKDSGVSRPKVNVVGFSNNNKSTISDKSLKLSCSMEQEFLKSICQCYYDGKIWSYHEGGEFDYVDDSPMSLSRENSPSEAKDGERAQRSRKESEILLESFPGARQILFAPLWDSSTGISSPEYFSGCFAVSNREVPVFTTEIEVAFVRAFVNSVGVICGHLTASISEKQKSQFISSMSHELRSPLHGILASNELLYGTPLNATQTDLCDTVEICGQTLLDTLSQILDYSKVNNFLRDTHKANEQQRKHRASGGSPANTSNATIHAGSSLHVYSECDVAELCEEALEVISLSSKATSAYQISMVTSLNRHERAPITHKPGGGHVVIDFTVADDDWLFLCSPGAIRRIVMNLVSNSLKYTERGSISVGLSIEQEGERSTTQQTVKISVVDSGQGMSDDFIRNRLFVPFSQENAVAPGSGLGLSLVQGIVKSLEGKIEVSSKLGRGTKMDVFLPLTRPTNHTDRTDEVMAPQGVPLTAGKTYKILSHHTKIDQPLQQSIRHYMRTWWHMAEVQGTELTDFIFLDTDDLIDLLQKKSQKLSNHAIVLSQISSAPDVRAIKTTLFDTMEPLRIPFGPRKLRKTILACMKIPAESHAPPTSMEEDFGKSSLQAISERTNVFPRPPGPDLDTQSTHSSAVPGATALPFRNKSVSKRTSQPVPEAKDGPAVLCVDDNAINLKLLNTFVKKLGFESVASAEDGLQAFQLVEARSRGFEVIFMDLTMPVMDGFESTRRIRILEAERKGAGELLKPSIVVALTGLASEDDQKKAFAAGVDHFVTKPLRFKDLKQMFSEWNIHGSPKADEKKSLAV